MSKKITQFEYDMIKACWKRNTDPESKDCLKALIHFEQIDIHGQMSLASKIEQSRNIGFMKKPKRRRLW
jgi:hypothetical protein